MRDFCREFLSPRCAMFPADLSPPDSPWSNFRIARYPPSGEGQHARTQLPIPQADIKARIRRNRVHSVLSLMSRDMG